MEKEEKEEEEEEEVEKEEKEEKEEEEEEEEEEESMIWHGHYYHPLFLPPTSLFTMVAMSSSCSAKCWNESPITMATNREAIASRWSARNAWITNI